MSAMGFVKKVVPFFLTFAVGLFVASFSVSIAVPNFKIPNRGWKRHHQQYHQRIESDNQRLRELNLRLEKSLAELKRTVAEQESSDAVYANEYYYNAPPPVPPAPYKSMSQRR